MDIRSTDVLPAFGDVLVGREEGDELSEGMIAERVRMEVLSRLSFRFASSLLFPATEADEAREVVEGEGGAGGGFLFFAA